MYNRAIIGPPLKRHPNDINDPGIFARVVQARLPENSSDNGFCLFFCPQLLQFYSGFSMVYFKENYNFTRFRGGGGGGGGGSGSKC